MTIESEQLQHIIEGAILASTQPLTLKKIASLFETESGESTVSNDELRAALAAIVENCRGRGFELKEVGSGWRFQVSQDVAPWVNRLWDEKPQKYSRALLETLALVAYRQPITRGDIEEIRGVAVSSHIIRTLVEREWVKVVGHRDVPGRPSLFATTRKFLDYFNLKSLEELPTLGELRDLEALAASLEPELALEGGNSDSDGADEGDEPVAEEVLSEESAEAAVLAESDSFESDPFDSDSSENDYAQDSCAETADLVEASESSEPLEESAQDDEGLFEPASDSGSLFAVEAAETEIEDSEESLLEAMPDEYLESVMASASDERVKEKD